MNPYLRLKFFSILFFLTSVRLAGGIETKVSEQITKKGNAERFNKLESEAGKNIETNCERRKKKRDELQDKSETNGG